MTDRDIEKLREIMREIMDLGPNEDVDGLRKMTSRRWDSLAQVSIVSAIESEFDVKVQVSDIDKLNSFQSVKIFLEENGF